MIQFNPISILLCLIIIWPGFMGKKGAPHWRENRPRKRQNFWFNPMSFAYVILLSWFMLRTSSNCHFGFCSMGIWYRDRVLGTHGSKGRHTGRNIESAKSSVVESSSWHLIRVLLCLGPASHVYKYNNLEIASLHLLLSLYKYWVCGVLETHFSAYPYIFIFLNHNNSLSIKTC